MKSAAIFKHGFIIITAFCLGLGLYYVKSIDMKEQLSGLVRDSRGLYDFDKMPHLLKSGMTVGAVLVLASLGGLALSLYRRRFVVSSVILTIVICSLTAGALASMLSVMQYRSIKNTANKKYYDRLAQRLKAERDQEEQVEMAARKRKQEERERQVKSMRIVKSSVDVGVDLPRMDRWNSVMSACVSPDCSKLLIAGGSAGKAYDNLEHWAPGFHNTASVFDLHDNKTITELRGHPSAIMGITMAPSGLQAATACLDGNVRVYDLKAGAERLQPTLTMSHDRGVRCVSYTPNGAMLISGGIDIDGSVRVWNAANGDLLRQFDGFTSGVYALACSPDGSRVALAGNGTAVVDIATSTVIYNLASGEGRTLAVAYSRDGRYIATGGRDTHLRIWDAGTAQLLKTIPAHNGQVYSLAWLPDNKSIASAGYDGRVRFWNASTGKRIRQLQGIETQDAIKAITIDPQRETLYAFAVNGVHYAWDYKTILEENAAK